MIKSKPKHKHKLNFKVAVSFSPDKYRNQWQS